MTSFDMKGYLSFLMLWIVSKGRITGAGISSELQKRRGSRPSPGTIYPVLRDLKEQSLIDSNQSKEYSITSKGQKELKKACQIFCRTFYDSKEMEKCC